MSADMTATGTPSGATAVFGPSPIALVGTDMPWQTEGSSPRRKELPPDWYTRIRPAVLERDEYRCQWPRTERRSGICNSPANQVDHKHDRDSYELADLWSLCRYHHQQKTNQESADARRAIQDKTKHPVERHPGLL